MPSNDQANWYDANRIHGFQALMELVPVTNDHFNQNQNVTDTLTSATQTAHDVSKKPSILESCFIIGFLLFLFCVTEI